ncbi:FAD-binding domain-containing protein, partial [Eremomyces bilateralis CBS 781.70]
VGTIGGWAQAGGHNPLSREYGMQADNIVEFEVVLADGTFVKASECSNPDLFWALRGGGGSTFGIVTAATVKVYPTPPMA